MTRFRTRAGKVECLGPELIFAVYLTIRRNLLWGCRVEIFRLVLIALRFVKSGLMQNTQVRHGTLALQINIGTDMDDRSRGTLNKFNRTFDIN
jgi:hypothetical protein